MGESPSPAVPALPGLAVEAAEWLPSGAESGLVRVRGRWIDEAARQPDLPVLAVRAQGAEQRFESLPDARFSRDPSSWRGTYLVPAELVADDPEALWLEWAGGARAGLPALARGVEPPAVPAAPERPEEPEDRGGQVIDRAVLADRRARRAEAAEQAQARKAAEALKAVEVLELRSAALERRLEEATAERDALAARGADDAGRREALAAALASAAALRSRSRELQLRLRVHEVTRAGEAVRLAVLESERSTGAAALRAALHERTAELEAANDAAASARASLQDAEARFAEARAAWERRREELESELGEVRAELEAAGAAEGRARTAETALAAAESRLRVEAVARATLEDELDRERAARATAEQRLRATEHALRQRIADLEHRTTPGPEDLDRLAREQAEAAAAQEPPADAARLVADLDEAADSLRRQVPPPTAAGRAPPPADGGPPGDQPEPAAPDAEPAVEWGPADRSESGRRPVAPGVEPRRAAGDAERRVAWAPPPLEPATEEDVEPPAPDAEPFVESAPPAAEPAPPAPEPAPLAGRPVAAPGGPRIVPASKPPARALMVGTERRAYPLLRGAIVKLAHDDPALAGRLLAALLPAQGAVLDGPIAYDLTIAGTGTFAVAISGGRASVDPIERPRPRGEAEFHLRGDPLVLAELLAGVQHRIGRLFGPVRVQGRKGRVKALRPLATSTVALSDAARAGARLDPELAYRTLAYAVHPSWTRGHAFTIAQAIVGDPTETWYLTARDGAGVAVSAAAPDTEPAATVSMTRAVFDRLLRAEPVAGGERPTVRGDREAVALMRAWTRRAQGAE